MKGNNRGYILLIILLLIGGGIILLIVSEPGYDWQISLRPENNQPYRTELFQRLLQVGRGTEAFVNVEDSLHDVLDTTVSATDQSYIFIGNRHYADRKDARALIRFIENGNSAYLFVDDVENSLFDSLMTRHPIKELENKSMPVDSVVISDDQLTSSDDSLSADTLVNGGEDNSEDNEDDEVIETESANDEPVISEDDEAAYEEGELIIKPLTTNGLDSLAMLQLKDSSAKCELKYVYDFKPINYYWTIFSGDIYATNGEKAEELGSLTAASGNNFQLQTDHQGHQFIEETPKTKQTRCNFIRVKRGKGYLYVHLTPIAFSNYFLRNDTVMNYCRSVLKDLGSGKIYWDEENAQYHADAFQHQQPTSRFDGPLEFILSERTLRTAWYILLAGAFLYLVFGAKRKQRYIPMRERLDNTSIEYAEVIAQLFLRQKEHGHLIRMKMDLFRAFLRERFNVKFPATPGTETDAFYADIAARSNVSEELIKNIFNDYKYLSSIEGVGTDAMLNFHMSIEAFYKTCK